MTFGFDDVTVKMGDLVALDAVDLRIEPGDVTAVIGADGAGKTTTARTLVGLLAPTTGTVRRPDRKQIGYQPERAGTWLDLTVTENLRFVAVAYGQGDRHDRMEEVLEITKLGEASDRLAGDLSGGMRQKLAVGMAMLPRPRLVVLDEPTTGLDPVSRADLWRLLTRATADGAAVVVTTSYLDEAERASHVLVLDGGGVLVSGTATQIRESFTGSLAVAPTNRGQRYSWRRGSSWRVWNPDGTIPDGMVAVDPDLADVVTVAALTKRSDAA